MSGSGMSIGGPGASAPGSEVGRIGGPSEGGAQGGSAQQSTFDTLRGQHPHPSEGKQAGDSQSTGKSQQQQLLQQVEKEIQQLLQQLQQLQQGGQQNQARSGDGSGGECSPQMQQGDPSQSGSAQQNQSASGNNTQQQIHALQQQLQQLQKELGQAANQMKSA